MPASSHHHFPWQDETAAIIRASSDAVFSITGEGMVVSWNSGAERIFGYTISEMINKPLDAVVPPDRRAEFASLIARVKQGEQVIQVETECARKDQRRIAVSITMVPLTDAGGTVIGAAAIARDINNSTLRDRQLSLFHETTAVANQATSLEEAIVTCLRLICESAGWELGHAYVTMPGSTESTQFWWYHGETEFQVFRTHFERSGLPSRGDPAGRVFATGKAESIPDIATHSKFPLAAQARAAGLNSTFACPILSGRTVVGVLEFFSKNTIGRDDPFLNAAAEIGVQLGRVFERMRAEQTLLESEERYRVMAQTAADGIISIDDASIILFANEAVGRIFGYSSESLLGQDLTILMPEYLRHVHRASVRRYLETGKRHLRWEGVELPGLHQDGHEVPLEISFGEFILGGRHYFTGFIRDIGERKRFEEQLRESQKLESLGVLAGGVAHEFNNLLTGILGNVSLAADSLPLDTPARAPLQKAVQASQQAADLVRQLLAYAGKGRFVMEPVILSSLIQELSVLVRTSIPRNVQLRLDLAADLPPVQADRGQMQQLITNVVMNGAEAIPDGQPGSVTIKTAVQAVDEEFISTAIGGQEIAPGQYVLLEVSDTGVGMDETTIARIFEPFFTTKFTGRGLGLSAVQGIVRAHGGGIKIHSVPGQGTVFKILLPAIAGDDSEPRRRLVH